jgi:hypothetical protein
MKGVAFSGWLTGIACGIVAVWIAQAPTRAQSPAQQPGEPLNQAIKSNLRCGEFSALLKAENKRTSGFAILWLDGFYSGRSGRTELPAGWVQTVSQGIAGTCTINVNASRTVLDVIGQVHREYGGRN